jgi:serine/threonine-protein kinase
MERIGEYLIKRMVGEGGMGKVYEAEERLSKRRVALKVLRPELTRSEDGRRLFLNEMQILAHLEHPNVVRSLASMEVDGQLVMVLEFLSGHTLREELTKRGKLPWHEALEVVSKIAEALEAAHSQEPPIIHRDLKPENVMITDGDGASGLKVMDFGIAKVLAAAHATNTQSIGTLQYMSPEQIDARTIDARSDLYSLGLIFYELIVGSPPFHSASPRELLNLQCTAEAPDLEEDVRRTIPRGVEELLFGLLEKAPADRPATAADVIAKLAPFRAAEPAPRRSRARATPAPGSASSPSSSPSSSEEASEDESEDSDSDEAAKPAVKGDTLHSTPHKAKKKDSGSAKEKERPPVRLDTIQLVERSGEGRDLSTGKAMLVILGLSIFAGVATYMVRAHGKGTSDVPSATASATQSPAP